MRASSRVGDQDPYYLTTQRNLTGIDEEQSFSEILENTKRKRVSEDDFNVSLTHSMIEEDQKEKSTIDERH